MSTTAGPSPVPAVKEREPPRTDEIRRKLAIRKAYNAAYYEYQRRDMMYLLIILRFINAITIRTFFQPDEYYQALEPAWQMAFGESSGAWITWVRISPYVT
jgi:phosphatidylinositol glycan class B